MTRIIVITSGKGGVGKTTTTSNIGMTLANIGYKTLLVDADIGLRNLDLLLGLENRIIYTGLDVLAGTCRLEQALIQDKRQKNLAFFPLASIHSQTPITEEETQQLIDMLTDLYDYILIDSPAGIDGGFNTAVKPANEAVVVVTPEVPSIRDADKVIGLLVSKGVKKIGLVINRIRPKMVKSEDMMSIDDVKNILGVPLVGIIPDCEQIIIASNRGEPIVLDSKLSLAGLAFQNTARRLAGETVEFIDLESNTSKNPVKRILEGLIKKSSK
jgi:septum site-determining protein MinD